MKKFTAIALALLLVAGLVPFTAVAGATATPQAVPAPAVVYVDGAPRTFEAYQIAGLTYFKLIDIGTALKDGKAKFNVEILDAGLNLRPGKPYGNTITKLDTAAKEAKPYTENKRKIYVNGKPVTVKSYFIGQSSYYLLIDLGNYLNFEVSRDPATATTAEPNGAIRISTANTKPWQEYLLQEIRLAREKIDLSRFCVEWDEFHASHLADKYAEFYIVEDWKYDTDYVTCADGTQTWYINFITPVYRGNPADVKQKLAALDGAVKQALAAIPKDADDLRKIAAINDCIIFNTAYAFKNGEPDESKASAYGVLVEHLGVCAGYSAAFNYLASKAGIESITVSSESMNHAWNMVKLDGKWYHVDTTWNDPVNGTGTQPVNYGEHHTHLLLSDKGIGKNHYGWSGTAPKADDTAYDEYFWQSISMPLDLSVDLREQQAAYLSITLEDAILYLIGQNSGNNFMKLYWHGGGGQGDEFDKFIDISRFNLTSQQFWDMHNSMREKYGLSWQSAWVWTDSESGLAYKAAYKN